MKKSFFVAFCMLVVVSIALGQTTTKEKTKKPYDYLGKFSSNPYDPDSVTNPYGKFGSPYGNTVNNPYSKYGSPYSPSGVRNPYSSGDQSPFLIGEDGEYLGKVNSNPYDLDSISNPYGRYGSKYSPDSVNNPYGRYGSQYSPDSANNPYTTKSPKIYAPSPFSIPAPKAPKNSLKWPFGPDK